MSDEILREFTNNFPSLVFISRKTRCKKSKCKENDGICVKVKSALWSPSV